MAIECITLDRFEQDAEAYDRAVDMTPGIDPFCSGTDWIVPLRRAWGADLEPWLRAGDMGRAAFLRHEDTLFGMDVMWGFACPLVGEDPAEFVEPCLEAAEIVLVPGIVLDQSWWRRLAGAFGSRARLAMGRTVRRWVASLEGGVDGFLARRSRKFRENLRRAGRRAADEGVVLADASNEHLGVLFSRIVSIERRSWKAAERTGLLAADVYRFYEEMAQRLGARDALRATIAQRDGVDVGYLLGAVRGPLFRGLQKSYDVSCAHLSLGHLMQMHRVRDLVERDPQVRRYDLGMDMDYKRLWGDTVFETVTLAAIRD